MSNSNNKTCRPQALFWFYKRSTVNPFHGNVLWEISLQSLTRKWIWVQLQCDKHCDWLEINHNIDFLQSQLFPIRGKQTLERTFLIKSKYISTFESFIYGPYVSFCQKISDIFTYFTRESSYTKMQEVFHTP